MDNTLIVKMSDNGKITIPKSIRKSLNWQKGAKLAFNVQRDSIQINKLPTANDWADLIKDIPVENVDIDQNGHYDAKKSPHFHEWMVNG